MVTKSMTYRNSWYIDTLNDKIKLNFYLAITHFNRGIILCPSQSFPQKLLRSFYFCPVVNVKLYFWLKIFDDLLSIT